MQQCDIAAQYTTPANIPQKCKIHVEVWKPAATHAFKVLHNKKKRNQDTQLHLLCSGKSATWR